MEAKSESTGVYSKPSLEEFYRKYWRVVDKTGKIVSPKELTDQEKAIFDAVEKGRQVKLIRGRKGQIVVFVS